MDTNFRKKKLQVRFCIGALTLLLAMWMTGCGGASSNGSDTSGSSSDTTEAGNADASDDTVPSATADDAADAASTEPESEPVHVTYVIDYPSDTYYLREDLADIDVLAQSLFLRLLEEKENGIIDEEDWFQNNALTKRRHDTDGYLLHLQTDPDTSYTLDFSAYMGGLEKETLDELEYSYYYILDAVVRDRIAYVSTGHLTYSKESPHTAYITAIDLTDGSVLWKSAALTNNARMFAIVDDTILCGYGFTAEPDYLILLDATTGTEYERILLKTAPEYIIAEGNILYVRCYDTDYRFELLKEPVNAGEERSEKDAAGSAQMTETDVQYAQFMAKYRGDYEAETLLLAGSRIRYRMVVIDAALGNRLYGLLKSTDDGAHWFVVSLDPFQGRTGNSVKDFSFTDEMTGYATLTHNGGGEEERFKTTDGGKTFLPEE